MKTVLAFLSIAVGLVLVPSPATAGRDVDTELTCPAGAVAGDAMTLGARLENHECIALDVRLIASIVGVASPGSGLRVFGPVVAEASVAVPAGTDDLPGTCDLATGSCDGSGGTLFCFADADCQCVSTTPGITDVALVAPLSTPASLAGSVVTYLVLSEWDGGGEKQIDRCLVELPEPSFVLQLVSGVIGLLALSRRRAVWR